MKRKKIIQCINCRLHRLLIPRCEFEVEITDASGTVTATMSDKLAEKMLSMTAHQIYETIIVKKQLIPVEHVRKELSQKWLKIHLQKSYSGHQTKHLVHWLFCPSPKNKPSLICLQFHRQHT